MKSLKQILEQTGIYEEPPVKKSEVPERETPPQVPRKRWTTLGEVMENPSEYGNAVGRWVGKLLKDFWNGIVGRIESLVRKCRV